MTDDRIITIRLSQEIIWGLDARRGDASREEHIRKLVAEDAGVLDESKATAMLEKLCRLIHLADKGVSHRQIARQLQHYPARAWHAALQSLIDSGDVRREVFGRSFRYYLAKGA
jgi:hypothetical protein